MAGTPSPEDVPTQPTAATAADPVLVKRRQMARFADLGQRIGYGLFGVAIVLFLVAMVTDLPGAIVTAIIITMVLGSLVLAPAIVVGYGVRAADREDRERAAARNRRTA
jgi:hypothetical protein